MKKMLRKLVALLLTLCMIGTAIPFVMAYAQVSNGSRGEDVRTMQTMLNTVMGAGLDTDGICGPKSVAAIKAFQSAYGLTADGICGRNTWAKLEEVYTQKTNPVQEKPAGTLLNNNTTPSGFPTQVVEPEQKPHEHKYGDNGVCDCGTGFTMKVYSYTERRIASVVNGCNAKKTPYAVADNMRQLKKGDRIEIVGYARNAHNNLWYETAEGFWVYSGHVTFLIAGTQKTTETIHVSAFGSSPKIVLKQLNKGLILRGNYFGGGDITVEKYGKYNITVRDAATSEYVWSTQWTKQKITIGSDVLKKGRSYTIEVAGTEEENVADGLSTIRYYFKRWLVTTTWELLEQKGVNATLESPDAEFRHFMA